MKYIVLILFVSFLFITEVPAASIKIDRVWEDNGYAYVLVSYTNNSKITYKNYIKIKCTALDEDSKKININTRSFFSHDYGPIKPGFKDTVKVPINLNGFTMESVSCNCVEN